MVDVAGMPQYDGMDYEELVCSAQFLWLENAKLREELDCDGHEVDLPKPICAGMSRTETTSLLDSELVRLRFDRKNSYSFWAHEVWIDRHTDHERRVDFVEFMPRGGPTYSDAPHIEHGTFSFYEVKSCMSDLKSGHGLNFYGDENWLVMPVEMFEPYKEARINDEYVRARTSRARCLLYGLGRNGKPTFWEQPSGWTAKNACRKHSASELLFAIMRAMIANSGHSGVNHHIKKY